MVTKATIAYDNIIDRDETVFSASNTVATLPASNLADAVVGRVMRCVGTTTTIQITADAATPFQQCGFFGIAEAITDFAMTLKASNVSMGASEILNFDGASPGTGKSYQKSLGRYSRRQALADFGAAFTAKYIEIAITTTGANVEFGRLVLAPVVAEMARNITWPIEGKSVDQSLIKRMTGADLVFERPVLAEWTVAWGDGISDQDLLETALLTLDRVIGLRKQVIYTQEPGGTYTGINTTTLGRFQELGPLSQIGYARRGKTFRILES